MRSFRYTIHIDRSPAHVWAVMMDFSKAPRWRKMVREVKILTDGPLRPGTELQITFDVHGRVQAIFGTDYNDAGEHYDIYLQAFDHNRLIGAVHQSIDVV